MLVMCVFILFLPHLFSLMLIQPCSQVWVPCANRSVYLCPNLCMHPAWQLLYWNIILWFFHGKTHVENGPFSVMEIPDHPRNMTSCTLPSKHENPWLIDSQIDLNQLCQVVLFFLSNMVTHEAFCGWGRHLLQFENQGGMRTSLWNGLISQKTIIFPSF